jgi:hypothetical protein
VNAGGEERTEGTGIFERRSAVFVLGAIVGAALTILVGALAGGDGEERPIVIERGGAIAAEDQARLAAQFRPLLHFDSEEPWRPVNIESFLGERFEEGSPGHRLCPSGSGDCRSFEGLAGFLGAVQATPDLGNGLYLDVAGERPNGADAAPPSLDGCDDPAPRDCDVGDSSAIYYNVTAANGRFYIDYWWFLRYNDFPRAGAAAECGPVRIKCSDHEGDWEGVTVVTTPRDPPRLEYVAFSAHGRGFRYANDQVQLFADHPRVYVARGSHASYPIPCQTDRCRQNIRVLGALRLPDGRFDGKAEWGRNANESCDSGRSCLLAFPPLDFNPASSWNAFAGQWGRLCAEISAACPVAPGPRSPSKQDRFTSPWCSQLGERVTCDALTPGQPTQATPGLATKADCRAWLGDVVAALACDKRSVAAGLRPRPAGNSGGFELRIGDAAQSDAATPGVAQVLGAPVREGQEVIVSGIAPQKTQLIVRAQGPGGVVEATFRRLGLRNGGKGTVTIHNRDGVPRLTLRRPDGTTAKPRTQRLG